MVVFIKKPVQKRSLWQKVWGKQIEENMVIEINNLLASKPILEVTPEEIYQISNKYDAVTIARGQKRLLGYYHLYLQMCLEDKKLSEHEIAELAQLKLLLNLPDRMIKQIHQAVVSRLYGVELRRTMDDGAISSKEQEFLRSLSKNLLLSQDKTEEILASQAGKQIKNLMDNIMSDERITPEEEESYNSLINNLGVLPDVTEQTRENYERFKMYWRLENKDLPLIYSDLIDEKEETAHFRIDGKWFEAVKTSREFSFNRLSGKLATSQNVYWRQGYPGELDEEFDKWNLLDTGEIILSNKRIIFDGQTSKKEIKIEKITDFLPYRDGIRINRKREEAVVLETGKDGDFIAIILNRLIGDL